MANCETYGRTSYFRVIEGKEAEFIEFVQQLGEEGVCEIHVDSTTKPENLPEGEFNTDPRGFAITDCGDLQVYDEEADDYVDGLEIIAERFLRPGCAIFSTIAYHEKMRYMGGGASMVSKSVEGELVFKGVDSLRWVQDQTEELKAAGIEVTDPTY